MNQEIEVDPQDVSPETPGSVLRAWRNFYGLTIESLAKQLGVSWLTLQRWETDRQAPPGNLLFFALKYLEAVFRLQDQEQGRERQEPPALPQ